MGKCEPGHLQPLAPADAMPMVLRAHPFSSDPGVVYARPGLTIGQMLREAAGDKPLAPLEVRAGGHVVPPELWDRVRPKQGTTIHVTGLPESNMNSNWRAVLMIVVAVVAWFAAPTVAGWFGVTSQAGIQAFQAGIYMAGSLAVNALVKPPQPLSRDRGAQWHQLTGNSNQINPGGPIPHVLGEARYFPPHAALPYSVATGDHSWQYCLFDLGYNCDADDISDIRIGDTPIGNFEGVTMQIGTNPSLYRNDTSQLYIGVTMEGTDEVIRTTAAGTETISLDFFAPQGIYGINDTGQDEFGIDVFWDVHYRPVGTTTWLQPPSPRLSNLNHHAGPQGMYTKWFLWYDPLTFGLAWDVPAGQYDVRVVRRDDNPTDNNTYVDMVVLNSLLSVRQVPASRTGTMKLALRIRSDNQLNGTLQTVSVMQKPKVPVYNEGTGTWTRQRTLNAGWIYRYLLVTSPATLRRVAPTRINLPQVLDAVDFIDRHGFETRMVVDTSSTVGQVLDMVLRTSACERTMTDGKYGITFVPDSQPLAEVEYAETEVKDFRISRVFGRIPNALRVKFRNPQAGWQDDEIIVLDDGYSYRGVDARGNASSLPEPTTFEEMNLQATMLPQQAWRLGRMHYAQAKFSPASYSWMTDVAGLKMTKGSAVGVTHYLPQWGEGAATVTRLTAGGPTGVATLVLDAEIATEPGEAYRMQIRGPTGTQVMNAVPHSPFSATFYLSAMPTGDIRGHVAILSKQSTAKPFLLVTYMRPTKQLDFTVSAVAWDERAAPFWANPPEDLVSEISGRAYTEPPDPPDLVVGTGEENDDAGIRRPVVNVRAPDRGARHLPVYEVLAR